MMLKVIFNILTSYIQLLQFSYFLNCLTSEEKSIFFSVNPEKRREDFSKNESPKKFKLLIAKLYSKSSTRYLDYLIC